ncbi:MAG TPA: hypothetical protein VFT22_34945, partial [Kofleriaceae bacterium]|nr:hypothetical protein [Kofleriaceae bacterium]
IDDGGFFFLEWDLFDASNRLVSCADAGSTAVETTATVTNGTDALTDTFDCTDHYGVTDPLPAGSYTVAIEALAAGMVHVGGADTQVNRQIKAPGGYTDLGLVKIHLDQ